MRSGTQDLKIALTIVIMSSLISGCTTVRFNERERLAEKDMVFDSNPLQSTLENHVYNSREASTGVFSAGGGGGCGCY